MQMQSPTNITPIILEWLIPNSINLVDISVFFSYHCVLQKNIILQFFSNIVAA